MWFFNTFLKSAIRSSKSGFLPCYFEREVESEAGFLSVEDRLDKFWEEICSNVPREISKKLREIKKGIKVRIFLRFFDHKTTKAVKADRFPEIVLDLVVDELLDSQAFYFDLLELGLDFPEFAEIVIWSFINNFKGVFHIS